MPPVKGRLVAVNEQGRRIGEDHQRAKISDETVGRLRELHEAQGLGSRRLAKMFGLNRRTVQDILRYRTRAQWVARAIRVVDK